MVSGREGVQLNLLVSSLASPHRGHTAFIPKEILCPWYNKSRLKESQVLLSLFTEVWSIFHKHLLKIFIKLSGSSKRAPNYCPFSLFTSLSDHHKSTPWRMSTTMLRGSKAQGYCGHPRNCNPFLGGASLTSFQETASTGWRLPSGQGARKP